MSDIEAKVEAVASDIGARVARLERVATIGHSVDLSNYDDADQKDAREKQVAADKEAEDKANEKAAAAVAKATAETEKATAEAEAAAAAPAPAVKETK